MTYLFSALADPTRRQIFERLAKGAQPVGKLAQGLPISRPAVSQHLAALKAAGLVTDHAEGTRRIYRIDPKGLAAIRIWLDQFWTEALDGYVAEVERSSEDPS
ncbi:ArsR/SmtB family transcription factor [Aestuariivirga sp. YIM B02566]|uniref:Winged helix-turn-helix transcriptional regulator n=1 Tax=Taklimakanibacter albus TaxID=2800327 RepID=A0ACC5R2F8_9HYPH|nr:metalloregulator ArsR/SmtB family transcription factor [Aestuariivirga sp. YIM B02566]MBK1866840.1 winged helix-turn-helix transcriptional regulator [Aestuariivirga sp. YIM B02566]